MLECSPPRTSGTSLGELVYYIVDLVLVNYVQTEHFNNLRAPTNIGQYWKASIASLDSV